MGYQVAGTGLAGWLSVDGEEWVALQQAYGLAFRPVIIPATSETIELARAQKRLVDGEPESGEPSRETPIMRTALSPPSPNPFNPQTRFRFTLREAQRVELEIHDVRGRLVKQLADQTFSAGEHVLTWKGRDDDGRDLASGVYMARFKAAVVVQTQRLMLVR